MVSSLRKTALPAHRACRGKYYQVSLVVKHQVLRAQRWLSRSSLNKRQGTAESSQQTFIAHAVWAPQMIGICHCRAAVRQNEMQAAWVHFLQRPDGLSVVHRSFTLSHQRFVFRHHCHCLVNFELSNAFDSPPSPALYCKCHNSSQKAFASQGKQDCLSGHLHNEQVHEQMALHFCPGLQEGGLTSFFQEQLKDPTDGLDLASWKLQFKKAGHRSSAAKSYEIGHLADMRG